MLKGRQIFLSYSHKDKSALGLFEPFFKQLARDANVRVWTDRDIKPGSRWREEIVDNLRAADVALLLVSQNYLASSFIASDELPPILEAARNRGMTIWWLLLSPCLFEHTAIAGYQAVGDTAKPFLQLKKQEQLGLIKELFSELTSGLGTAAAAPPPPAAVDESPHEFSVPLPARYPLISKNQQLFLHAIAQHALRSPQGRSTLRLADACTLLPTVGASEVRYRLEHLRLLGFVTAERTGPELTYRLSTECDRTLGRELVHPPLTEDAPLPVALPDPHKTEKLRTSGRKK